MDRMKSAFERAWERAERLEVDQEKLKELQYQPEGAKLAAQFLKEDLDLSSALADYKPEVKGYVKRGAEATFISNINLPKSGQHQRDTERAFEGLRLLKKDRSRLAQITERMKSLFAVYERERQGLYENLRVEVEKGLRQSLQQQGMQVRAAIQVESQPEFQQRWRQISTQLDMGYEGRLKDLKAELERLT